ncbi:phage virion morphogenesis protein [Citrobacter cronae]|uniref:phage virion morphogenesis protein n=1 Tax=Citrobacter cronae TaxID=1748967 RepID=UPI002DB9A606|nr:phage virion morphogenesis protein [Citrobacter cronae]MEB5756931.1 phage virion morphogenesis protein [Citrobacter cronae]
MGRFTGKVRHIPRVHQLGLKDLPNPHAQDVQYPERELLGFSQQDKWLLSRLIINHFSKVEVV